MTMVVVLVLMIFPCQVFVVVDMQMISVYRRICMMMIMRVMSVIASQVVILGWQFRFLVMMGVGMIRVIMLHCPHIFIVV